MFSATWAEHLERLRAVFDRLRRANLKLGARKCHLAAREVSFLGYKVTPEGLEPEPRLMEAISKLPPPINIAEVRSFLGLVGYYRRFVKKFSDKAAPLNVLLRRIKHGSGHQNVRMLSKLSKERSPQGLSLLIQTLVSLFISILMLLTWVWGLY